MALPTRRPAFSTAMGLITYPTAMGGNGFVKEATDRLLTILRNAGMSLQNELGYRTLLYQYLNEVWNGWNDVRGINQRQAIAADNGRDSLMYFPTLTGREPTQAERLAWNSVFTTASLWQPADTGGTFMRALAGLGESFKGLTQSPIWKITAIAVNVIPGIGQAVSAGMVVCAAIGKATSVQDAVIGAGRAVIPGGDAAKAGYDAATGILIHGQPIDKAALDFAKGQLSQYPDAQAAFDMAVALQAGIKAGTQPPPGLPPAAQAAFYAAHGTVVAQQKPVQMLRVNDAFKKSPIVMQASAKNIAVLSTIETGFKAGVDAAESTKKTQEASAYLSELRELMRKARAGDPKALATIQAIKDRYAHGDQSALLQLQMLATADRANRELDGAFAAFKQGLPGAWEYLKHVLTSIGHKVEHIFSHQGRAVA